MIGLISLCFFIRLVPAFELFDCDVIRTSQLTKRLVHNITFNSFLFDWRIQNDVNCFYYLQKYSRELHPFSVLNEADMFTWPYMLERLGCQHRPSQGLWLGGGAPNHKQWRQQQLWNRNFFWGQRYRRMKDQKPWCDVWHVTRNSFKWGGPKPIVKMRKCLNWETC